MPEESAAPSLQSLSDIHFSAAVTSFSNARYSISPQHLRKLHEPDVPAHFAMASSHYPSGDDNDDILKHNGSAMS